MGGKNMQQQQLLVGVDVGYRKHHVAIGGAKGIVDQFEIPHNEDGFKYFFSRIANQARQLKVSNVAVGMEGTNGYARPLDQMIKGKGYKLLNVNNLKLARFKEIFSAPAKTDSIDAKEIVTLMNMVPFMGQAKETLQEVYDVEETQIKLKRISRRRRQLVDEKVTLLNRMQADLQSVCPGFIDVFKDVSADYVLRLLSLKSDLRKTAKVRRTTLQKLPGIGKALSEKIVSWQEIASFGKEVDWVGPMIYDDAKRILELKKKIELMESQMKILLEQSRLAKIIESIPGFGIVTSCEIAGEIGTMQRFTSEAGLAIYLGMAPVDNSSGDYQGTKTPRQVNKRAKKAMMAALGIHIRSVDQSKKYYEKKRSEGKKYNQALRSLGRHLTRAIWSMVKNNRMYIEKEEEK